MTTLDEFLQRHDVTETEAAELRWYLCFLRWKNNVLSLIVSA
jgi:hypothetical protein